MPRREWVDGDRLYGADVTDYLMDQAVPTFADATERDADYPDPPTGALCYLADPGEHQAYDGAAWATFGAGVGALADLSDVNVGTPTAGDVLTWDDTPGEWIAAAGSGPAVPSHAAFELLAAGLEPLAIEPIQKGAFTYAVASNVTKLILSAWATRLGSGGRFEIREPMMPLFALRGATLTGLQADSTGVIIDPGLPSYADAWSTYHDRLDLIAATPILYIPLLAESTNYPLLPGPYGSILTAITNFDFAWIIAVYGGKDQFGWNLHNELGDGTSDYMRVGQAKYIPLSKTVCGAIKTGLQGSGKTGLGGVVYINVPSTWGEVVDANTYAFRDDFMGAALDTATVWNRTQSTAGNVEIQSAAGVANWCKVFGDGSWGNNGLFSQASVARTAGKVLVVDVAPGGGNDTLGYCNTVVGWHDGAGVSYTDMVHGIMFGTNGSGGTQLQAWENGTSRGAVGSGWTIGGIYRLRLTPEGGGANTCKYEIQGGPQYAAIGGATWTDITPGTSSSTTTPLHAGAVQAGNVQPGYLGDMRVY